MFHYRWIHGSEDYSDAMLIRKTVFMEEQGYTEEQERDEYDGVALHLAVYDDEKPVGCGRLIDEKNDPDAKHAGRIALLPEYRGKGLGKYIVDLLTEKARELGAEKVYIGAQKYAVPFYEKCGYVKCSVEYPDGHIPHIEMCRSLVFDNCTWQVFPEEQDAVIFRGDFELPFAVKSAKADILTLGFFEGYCNGQKISEDLYAPAWSDYCERDMTVFNYPIRDEICHRAYYMRYDITPFVKEGKNTFALHVGNGWYGQCESKNEGVTRYGKKMLCYKLTVTDSKGGEHIFSSSDLGFWRKSYIYNTNMYFGEYHDYRAWSPALFSADTDSPKWKRMEFCDAPKTLVCRQTCPPDRVLRNIYDPKVIYSFGDVTIYDIGENLAGFAVLKFPERAYVNDSIYVRYAENLNADGSLNFHSVGGTFRLGTDVFRYGDYDSRDVLLYPHFTWHAGRYVEVRGAHEFVCYSLAASSVEVSSTFESSDATLNWLYETYIRTQQSNIHCCVPSDCPHRERLGYTGDGQLTARAAMTVFDAKDMYIKWVRDIADCQDVEGGHVQHTAPFYGGGGGPGGWGCAMVAVPWYFYEFYGDASILEEYYFHMKKYLDYMQSRCEDHIVVREEPQGWCLGDWCPPGNKPYIPEAFVNTYFYIRSLMQAVRAADIIGMTDDVAELKAREKACREAMISHFFDSATGSFCGGIEGADAFALDIGLGDERTLQNLVEKYETLGMYDTGIFGTDLLTKVLFERGYASLAYRLLSGHGKVSFGYMQEHGATTLWENWDNSHSSSHPMFGAVVEYLFRDILGIRQKSGTCGFADVEISPADLPELEWARGSIKTPVGTIYVETAKGKLIKKEIISD